MGFKWIAQRIDQVGPERFLFAFEESHGYERGAHVRDKDLQTFESLAAESFRKKFDDKRIDMRVIIPAFMISELRRSFEIGFLIILPFLVIDMIVATLTMSMGMMMMPPSILALPFKVLFFVLIFFSRKPKPLGAISAMFLIGYGLARFTVEFAREPDDFLGLLAMGLSMGQWLSLPMIMAGIVMLVWSYRRAGREAQQPVNASGSP